MAQMEDTEAAGEPRAPLDVSAAQAAISSFLFRPGAPPKMPWEMPYEERRRASKDPRVMKQVAEEDQWKGTVCSGLWKRIRQHALPKNDWLLTREMFTQMLLDNGARGPQFVSRVFQLLDIQSKGVVNGLIMCKILHLSLTTAPLSELFARHCFERFDKPIGEDYISIDTIMKCQLLTPAEVALKQASKKKGKKGGGSPKKGDAAEETNSSGKMEAMVSGARYEMVEGLKAIIQGHNLLDSISFDQFRKFFSHDSYGEWIGSFFLHLIECCAKYFQPPGGSVPLIPLRWLKSIEPLPVTSDMYDADVVMLREIEITGIDPTQKGKDKKKKGKSASPKKK